MTRKNALLSKYMAGETSVDEESELRRLLTAIPHNELTDKEKAVLRLLSYARQEDDEDIFSVDYTAEYDEAVRPRHRIAPWYWIAAACAAGALFLFLIPPEERTVRQDDEVAELRDEMVSITASRATGSSRCRAFEEPSHRTRKPQNPQVTETPRRRATDLPAIPTSDLREDEAPIVEDPAEVPADSFLLTETDVRSQGQEPGLLITTYPERLEYTPEELEKLKERAHEKYLEWIQMEQEILDAEMRHLAELK